ncbi:MAG: hypothetical protein P1U63_00665 [Coxiellaceae bacterium]|nr:hypothetical protein [Coxiellaceae bacterium]
MSRKRRLEVSLLDELTTIMHTTRAKCPVIPNLALEGYDDWPHLQMLCVRHDFDDHVELYNDLKAIEFTGEKPNSTPLPVAISYDEEFKATTSVSELADWISSHLPKFQLYDSSKLADREEHLHLMAEKAEEWGAGNCGEMTAICYHSCKALCEKDARIQKVEYLNLDAHALLVINRATDSDISDCETWGDSCYILDAWNKECYQLQPVIDETVDDSYISHSDLVESDTYEVFAHHNKAAVATRPLRSFLFTVQAPSSVAPPEQDRSPLAAPEPEPPR